MPFFNRKDVREPEIHDPADIDDYFSKGIDINDGFEKDGNVLLDDSMDMSFNVLPHDEEEQTDETPVSNEELEDDSDEMEYDDTCSKNPNNKLYPPEQYDNEEGEESDDDFYAEDELRSSPESYIGVSRQMTSQSTPYSPTIGSEEQAYDVISGINDIPLKYRDDNYIPELVMPSLQYNLINGYGEKAEWQIKARSLIRKHQMNNPDFMLNTRDIAGITYINDVLLSRAFNGFERKLSIQSIQGTLEELNTEASPTVSQPKKKGILGGLFS